RANRLTEGRERRGDGDVELQGDRPTADADNLVDDAVRGVGIVVVGQDDAHTALGAGQCGGGADASAASGDDDDAHGCAFRGGNHACVVVSATKWSSAANGSAASVSTGKTTRSTSNSAYPATSFASAGPTCKTVTGTSRPASSRNRAIFGPNPSGDS